MTYHFKHQNEDDCREIARLLGMKFHTALWIEEGCPYISIGLTGQSQCVHLFDIYQDGQIAWEDTTGITNCRQICKLLEKYEL